MIFHTRPFKCNIFHFGSRDGKIVSPECTHTTLYYVHITYYTYTAAAYARTHTHVRWILREKLFFLSDARCTTCVLNYIIIRCCIYICVYRITYALSVFYSAGVPRNDRFIINLNDAYNIIRFYLNSI